MKYCIYGMLVMCAGCGASINQAESISAAIGKRSHLVSVHEDPSAQQADAEFLKRVLKNVNETLEIIYAKPLPENMPNWIAMHYALMQGENSYQQRDLDDNTKSVFLRIFNSRIGEDGPFVVRGGRPWPRHKGDRFNQEHHQNQFLHIFGMAGVPLEAELTVDGSKFQIRDLLEQSLLEARPVGELAFTVSAYAHFLDVGYRWNNKFGEPMSLALFVGELLKHPETTCGGQHRLGALACILSRPEMQKDPDLAALWPEIEQQVNSYVKLLRENKLSHGNFPLPMDTVKLFDSEEMNSDCSIVFFTGHAIEWVVYLLKDDQLQEEWIVQAVDRLANAVRVSYERTLLDFDLIKSDEIHYKVGRLAHAVSGLRRWRDKVEGIGNKTFLKQDECAFREDLFKGR